MRTRRAFMTLIGSTAVAWPLAARAQQPAKLPTIGFVGSDTPDLYADRLRAFRLGLKSTGFIEGQTVDVEYRWAEGRNGRDHANLRSRAEVVGAAARVCPCCHITGPADQPNQPKSCRDPIERLAGCGPRPRAAASCAARSTDRDFETAFGSVARLRAGGPPEM